MQRVLPFLFVLCLLSPATAAPPNRPNFVVVLIDDLRHDTFGFMAHPFIETPHIDSLAEGGARFRNAFVTTSLCSPARMSFLTGRYMHNHKVVGNADPTPQGIVTFPQLLQGAGYETAFIGKWHMGGSSDEPRPGFDHWVSFRGQGSYAPDKQRINVNGKRLPREKYMTDELSDYAVDWLTERAHQRPFLLYLSHKGVHGLYEPAERHRDRYRDADFTPPASMANTSQNYQGKPMWVRDQRNSWHGVEFPYHGRAKQSIEQMVKHYCEMILSIDESVGRILGALRKMQLEKNTCVVFTSDGGHLWGEHGLIDKRCAYEPSMRIPFLAYWPQRIPAGTVRDELVANIDLAPTLLELAGLDLSETTERFDGESLADLMRGEKPANGWRTELLYEYYWESSFPQTPTTFALRDERYKFIQYHGIWDTDELYDLREDPHEMRNLIRDPAQKALVAGFRRRLFRQLQDTGGESIPVRFKPNAGASRRDPRGTRRAEFPEYFNADPSASSSR